MRKYHLTVTWVLASVRWLQWIRQEIKAEMEKSGRVNSETETIQVQCCYTYITLHIFIISAIAGILLKSQDVYFFFSKILRTILNNSDICSAVTIRVRNKCLKLPTFQFSCDGTNQWWLCIHTPISLGWSDRMYVIMLSYAQLLRWSERVLIIRSPRASPAFKCECETLSTLSSYIFFRPRRIEGSVNLDYAPNNIMKITNKISWVRLFNWVFGFIFVIWN